MAKKLTTLEHAQHIVNTQNRVNRLTDYLEEYSYKKLDGKQWKISNIGDSRHFATGDMVSKLPKEDQQAINKYIVKKTRAAIKAGNDELKSMGVTDE